jgi:hypothetical protein
MDEKKEVKARKKEGCVEEDFQSPLAVLSDISGRRLDECVDDRW